MDISNRLADETSPYLRQHQSNPVHWQPWDDRAFALAKATNRPILLSIGYASCHWCHVMAHESFEDSKIAAALNRDFVSIKLDREERPDLDALFQHALGLLGERSGWPVTLFLTPDGVPFWGGTYFPPVERYGRPAFGDVLARVAQSWQAKDAVIGQNIDVLAQGLADLSTPSTGAALSLTDCDRIAQAISAAFDRWDGGFGAAPKFPQIPMLMLAWSGWKRSGDSALRDGVLCALDHMCQGGIYDHVGGGFARYSVDERWLAPHFEKMLYDNALFIEMLTAAWTDTGKDLYRRRIEETIAWVIRDLGLDGGVFAGSLDADWNGEEGGYYVWTVEEVTQTLGPKAALFRKIYEISRIGNFHQGQSIPNRLDHLDDLDPAMEAELIDCLTQLRQARAKRAAPARDDKILVDWNAMMISGLVRAGLALNRPDWIAQALQGFQSIPTLDDELRHSWCQNRPGPAAQLDDYAQMCRAALDLAEATGDTHFIVQAQKWVEIVHERFSDASLGYLLVATAQNDGIASQRTAQDLPNPSGNGVMMENLSRLYYLTGDTLYWDRAQAIAQAFGGQIAGAAFGFGTLINAQELLLSAVQIVMVGDDPDLWRAIHSVHIPTRVIARISGAETLAPDHPAFGKTLVAGKAAVYVCQGPVCSPPFTQASDLSQHLRRLCLPL